MVTNIEFVRQIVFGHAIVMVNGVGSDLLSLTQPYTHYAQTTPTEKYNTQTPSLRGMPKHKITCPKLNKIYLAMEHSFTAATI